MGEFGQPGDPRLRPQVKPPLTTSAPKTQPRQARPVAPPPKDPDNTLPPPKKTGSITRRRFSKAVGGFAGIVGVAELTRFPFGAPSQIVKPREPKSEQTLDKAWKVVTQRRAEKAAKDPEYSKRVDATTNKDRINLVIHNYAHIDPPSPYPDSITVISYNTSSGTIDKVSLSPWVATPEVEQEYLKSSGKNETGLTLSSLKYYDMPKKELVEKIAEDATGLSADFTLSIPDTLMETFLGSVLGSITVEVPKNFSTLSFVRDNKKYEGVAFKKGPEVLNAANISQFLDGHAGSFDANMNILMRRQMVYESIAQKLGHIFENQALLVNLKNFLKDQQQAQTANFNLDDILPDQAPSMLAQLGARAASFLTKTKESKTIYIAHPSEGVPGEGVWSVREEAETRGVKPRDWQLASSYSAPTGKPFFRTKQAGEIDMVQQWEAPRQIVKQKLSA